MGKGAVVLLLSLLIQSILILPASSWAESFCGRVVRVVDGSMLEVFNNTTRERVRLTGANCLNYLDPYSRKAREVLELLVAGRVVTVKVTVRHRGWVEGEVLLATGASLCQELDRTIPVGRR